MPSKLGFAIVGCGLIARFHAKALAEVPHTKLVALVSRKAGPNAPASGQRQGEHKAAGAESGSETERAINPFHSYLHFLSPASGRVSPVRIYNIARLVIFALAKATNHVAQNAIVDEVCCRFGQLLRFSGRIRNSAHCDP